MSRTTGTTRPTGHLVSHVVGSEDGTPIEYLSVGSGPGLVIVHGTMQSAASQSELATALAGSFTVHLVNRRGRGHSGPYPALHAFDLFLEVEDVEAVVAATGSRHVLGISSGGIIAAEVALGHPELGFILFEPALVADGSVDLAPFLRRFDAEVARGDVPAYMVSALLGTQMGPAFLRFFPRRLLEATTRRMLAKDAGELPPGGGSMRELADVVPYDMRVVSQRADRIEDYRSLTGPALLVTAEKSPRYLRHAVDRLGKLLPESRTAVVDGVGHSATQNASEGGRPDAVARCILEQLAPTTAP